MRVASKFTEMNSFAVSQISMVCHSFPSLQLIDSTSGFFFLYILFPYRKKCILFHDSYVYLFIFSFIKVYFFSQKLHFSFKGLNYIFRLKNKCKKKRHVIFFLSSHELKAQMSFSDHLLSGYRLSLGNSVNYYIFDMHLSKPFDPFQLNLAQCVFG